MLPWLYQSKVLPAESPMPPLAIPARLQSSQRWIGSVLHYLSHSTSAMLALGALALTIPHLLVYWHCHSRFSSLVRGLFAAAL